MSNPVNLYLSEMYKKVGFFANWLPGDPIDIGAIGVLTGGRFRQESSLGDLKIPFKENDSGFPQDLRYTSSSGVSVSTSEKVAVAATATAEVSIEFSQQGAFLFHASGLRKRQFEKRTVITRAVLDADAHGRWKKNWVLVDALHTADYATIIVSESSNAGVVLTAQVSGPVSVVSLTDPKLGLQVTSSQGRLVQVICAQKLRPLYQCVRLSGGWLPGSEKRLEARGANIASVGIRELLDS
ncbi:hypothetical protein Q8F57_000390 [Paraburkholderia terrae]|uniref:hypothetical protein n=1 Tax=Paraburkholderia terrae TaxID=311230 RepID=UPI00296A9907|nr:hypothetical protein [Paraburkholderia terrae]MDW3660576.1 hypothetical protein [Paraburkholderia terrae]